MKKNNKWLFAMLYVIYSAVYISRLNLSIASPLMLELGYIDKAALGVMSGVFFICFSLGSIAGVFLAGFSISFIGIKAAFIVPGIFCAVAALIAAFCLPDDKKKETAEKKSLLISPKEVGIVLLPAFLHGIIKDNINTWAPTYFADTFGIDFSDSSRFLRFVLLATVLPLLGLVGRITYNFIYKLCGKNEHLVSALGFAAIALSIVPLIVFKSSMVAAAICLGIISAAIQVINSSMLSEYPMRFADKGAVSSVSGIMDLFTYAGTGISSIIYGYVIKSFGYNVMYISWIAAAIAGIAILISKIHSDRKSVCGGAII